MRSCVRKWSRVYIDEYYHHHLCKMVQLSKALFQGIKLRKDGGSIPLESSQVKSKVELQKRSSQVKDGVAEEVKSSQRWSCRRGQVKGGVAEEVKWSCNAGVVNLPF